MKPYQEEDSIGDENKTRLDTDPLSPNPSKNPQPSFKATLEKTKIATDLVSVWSPCGSVGFKKKERHNALTLL